MTDPSPLRSQDSPPHVHDHHHDHHHEHRLHEAKVTLDNKTIEANQAYFDKLSINAKNDNAWIFFGRKSAETIYRVLSDKPSTTTCQGRGDGGDLSLLDYACGMGIVSIELINLMNSGTKSGEGDGSSSSKSSKRIKRVVGADVSTQMLKLFQEVLDEKESELSIEKGLVEIKQIEKGPQEIEEVFDIVICCQAYHHFPDIPSMTESLTNKLKPGGSLIIIDFFSEKENPTKDSFDNNGGIFTDSLPSLWSKNKGWTKEEMAQVYKDTGLFGEVIVEPAWQSSIGEIRAMDIPQNWKDSLADSSDDQVLRWIVGKGVKLRAGSKH